MPPKGKAASQAWSLTLKHGSKQGAIDPREGSGFWRASHCSCAANRFLSPPGSSGRSGRHSRICRRPFRTSPGRISRSTTFVLSKLGSGWFVANEAWLTAALG